jgi:AcrR family transcriptional regulator
VSVVQEHIADSFINLLRTRSYSKITIQMICDNTPASRNAFYYYFENKEKLVEWICRRDYIKNCVPYFKIRTENIGVQSMFSYLQKEKKFYTAIYDIDGGVLLQNCLTKVYREGVSREIIDDYANPVHGNQPKIDLRLFSRYISAGVVAVIMFWIENDMAIPIEDLAGDITTMMAASPNDILTKYLF